MAKETLAYARSHMPGNMPATYTEGIKTDQQMVDHMMREANVSRHQALIMMNCLYQTVDHNLRHTGGFTFKDLFSVKVQTREAKPEKNITTRNGIGRKYKPKPPTAKLKVIPHKILAEHISP